MDAVTKANLIAGRGIDGNANQAGQRQVTLIEQEVWAALMSQLGGSLPSSARRANLVVRDFRLADSRGRVLQLGPSKIRILGETKPCEQMEAVLPGLRVAMYPSWRGGAYGEVLVGGVIRAGDRVDWELL